MSFEDFQGNDAVFGDVPNASRDDIQQSTGDNCALRCQEIIMRDFGLNISEVECAAEAASQGWYIPGEGTLPENVGNVLELHGIPVSHTENANIFSLVNELAQGHRVIVAVDSGELWGSDSFLESLQEDLTGISSGADHAVIVSKIDMSDPDNCLVTLTDPGTGDVAKVYTLEEFQDAWKDSNCMMVSTDEAPPQELGLPEMANFDYESGHIESVFGMLYEQFSDIFSSFGLGDFLAGTDSFNGVYDNLCDGTLDREIYDALRQEFMNEQQEMNLNSEDLEGMAESDPFESADPFSMPMDTDPFAGSGGTDFLASDSFDGLDNDFNSDPFNPGFEDGF